MHSPPQLEGTSQSQGWQSVRFKFLMQRNTRPVSENDLVVTAFRDGTVTLRSNRREDGFTFAEKEIGYQGVEPGDLVIHAMDAFAGAIGVSDSRGKCSPVCTVLSPRPSSGADTRFWGYYLRSLARSGYIASLAKGIRERTTDFRWRDAGNLVVSVPPSEVQSLIADFLDRETALIDQLIEKKQRMEDLLLQSFQSARDRVLIEAVGASDTCALRWMIEDICDGPFGSGLTSAHYSSDGVRVVRLQNIKDGGFDDRDAAFISHDYYQTLGDHDVRGGDLLVAGLGDEKNRVGRACVAPRDLGPAMVKADCFRLRLRREFATHEFAAEFLNSSICWPQVQALSKGVTRSRINLELVRRLRLPVCGAEIQQRVVREVHAHRKTTAKSASLLASSRLKLNEFRSALITAAVTGQIDVTTWGKQGQTDRRLEKIQEEMGA